MRPSEEASPEASARASSEHPKRPRARRERPASRPLGNVSIWPRAENSIREVLDERDCGDRDEAAGTAGMTLAERPEPNAAENDVVVQVHASGFTRVS